MLHSNGVGARFCCMYKIMVGWIHSDSVGLGTFKLHSNSGGWECYDCGFRGLDSFRGGGECVGCVSCIYIAVIAVVVEVVVVCVVCLSDVHTDTHAHPLHE